MQDTKLSNLRKKIDAIDSKILELLGKRSAHVQKVGSLKQANDCGNNFIRSGREAWMIRNVAEKGAGDFSPEALKAIWRNIIAASLTIEADLKIITQKNLGFEEYKLLIGYFSSFVDYELVPSAKEVLDKIDQHSVGVLPLPSISAKTLAKREDLKIFARIGNLFAIAKVEPSKSGDDKTLVYCEEKLHGGWRIAENLYEVEGFFKTVPKGTIIGYYGL